MKLRVRFNVLGMCCGLAAACGWPALGLVAGDVVIKSDGWRITYTDAGRRFDVERVEGRRGERG